jgi:hypothetical protein
MLKAEGEYAGAIGTNIGIHCLGILFDRRHLVLFLRYLIYSGKFLS